MELHKFQVCQGGARTVPHGDAIPCRNIRIAGVKIYLACTTCGQKCNLRGEGNYMIGCFAQHVSSATKVFMGRCDRSSFHTCRAGNEVDGNVVFKKGYIGMALDMFNQNALDRLSGHIVCVDNTLL